MAQLFSEAELTAVSSDPPANNLYCLVSVVLATGHIFRHDESHSDPAYDIPSDTC